MDEDCFTLRFHLVCYRDDHIRSIEHLTEEGNEVDPLSVAKMLLEKSVRDGGESAIEFPDLVDEIEGFAKQLRAILKRTEKSNA